MAYFCFSQLQFVAGQNELSEFAINFHFQRTGFKTLTHSAEPYLKVQLYSSSVRSTYEIEQDIFESDENDILIPSESNRLVLF